MANGNNRLTEDDFLNLVSDQFPQIVGQVEEGVSNVFGKPGLSPEEEDRLTRLNARAQQLSPIDIQGPQGSSRVGGNMYSYDVNPVVRGGQGLVENIVNSVRQKKLQGDPDQMKRSQEKIKAAEQELKKLEKAGLDDMTRIGSGASEEFSDAVHGDRRKKMQQLRSQIEQETKKLRDARGVQGQRRNLLEKEKEAKQSEQNIRDLVANISPRVAQTMFDRQETKEQQQRQHDLTLDEIEKRHEATMDEIRARNAGDGGSGSGLPAAVLNTLSENVGQVQEKIQGDVDALRTEKLRLQRAKDDEELRETMQERLPEGTTIDDRLDNIETEISQKNQRLNKSVQQMIEVSAARNNLDRATTARLLGYDPEELGYSGSGGGNQTGGEGQGQQQGNQGGQGQQSQGGTMSQSDLEEYAENVFDGNIEQARSFLESKGYTIQGN